MRVPAINTLLAGLAVVLSASALWLATRSQTFTHVTLDGRDVRMLVAGSGDATVVFENGCCPALEAWGKVQAEVARFATTVSYDRAGLGLSDDGPAPRDGRTVAVELHRILELAGFTPPYVLVGASLGGPYVRVFAGLYPSEVAGLVLVDPTAETGDFSESVVGELKSARETLKQAAESVVPPDIPVVVIDAQRSTAVPFLTPALRQALAESRSAGVTQSRAYELWLRGIPNGRLVVTEDSGHNVGIEQPELVVETVREVVAAARR
jgi:pimeloyl-ACP methyl ester carboxylesterase